MLILPELPGALQSHSPPRRPGMPPATLLLLHLDAGDGGSVYPHTHRDPKLTHQRELVVPNHKDLVESWENLGTHGRPFADIHPPRSVPNSSACESHSSFPSTGSNKLQAKSSCCTTCHPGLKAPRAPVRMHPLLGPYAHRAAAVHTGLQPPWSRGCSSACVQKPFETVQAIFGR